MEWRKEDLRYAIATAVAGAFVLYLMVANFGLVPNPLTRSQAEPTTTLAVPDFDDGVSVSGQGPAGPGAVPPSGTSVLGLLVDPPAPPEPTPQPADRTAPSVMVTVSGEVLLPGDTVTGTAGDDASGIAEVQVTFTLLSMPSQTRAATLACADATRRSCTWTVSSPSTPGQYTVTAQATDRAGNVGNSEPANVTVVSVPDPTSGSDDGVVGSVVKKVGSVTSSLVKTVGSLL